MTEPARRTHAACLLIVVVASATHLAGLDVPFVFDDLNSIVLNPHVRSLWPLSEAISAPDEATVAGRPLVALSLAVNYAVGGLDPRGYHVFNVACHVLSALLVFLLVQRTLRGPRVDPWLATRSGGLALATALLWSVHPLQTEAVTYVVQRTELMLGCCFLATLLAVQRGLMVPERRETWHGLAVVLCLLAMACKEVAAVLPVVVLLYDRAFHSRSLREALLRSGRLYLGLVLTWLVLAGLLLESPRDRSVGTGHGVTSLQYLLTQAQVIVHYLRLVLWPDPLTISYHWPIVQSPADVLLEGTLLLGLLGGTLWALRRRPALGFLGAMFFCVLAPTSSVLPIVTEVAAERRMYLPLLPVVVLAVFSGWRLIERTVVAERRRLVAASLVAVLTLASAAGSQHRIRDYESALTLWADAVATDPQNSVALFQLGWNLHREGRPEEALPLYERSYELEPTYVPNLTGMAACLQDLGHIDDAVVRHLEALEYEPDDWQTLHNLGLCAARQGLLAEAAHLFRRALANHPDDADVHSNLAVVLLHGGGDKEEAALHLDEALRLAPGHAQARTLLAELGAEPGER